MSGIPEMIDTMVANIPNAEKGFRLLFASEPFPGYQVKLEKVREEYEGVWYRWAENGEGWLCPALFLGQIKGVGSLCSVTLSTCGGSSCPESLRNP